MKSPKILISIIIVFSCLLASLFIFSTQKFESSAEFREKYAVFSLTIPNDLSFAGEKVPLDYFDVRESLDRELHINTYWQSSTIALIKKANRFLPEIEAILKANNIPDDFKYLAIAESGLSNVISPARASGFWQFLKDTGKQYDLEINEDVDERFNLEKSTRAACNFLQELHDSFGNWTMAAAAYNMGAQGLRKESDNQKESTYYNLYLNEETARYIFRILAIKLIIENPEKYGFHLTKKELYPELKYQIVTVKQSIPDLAEFAKANNTNYKLLKIFNPWLRSNSLSNKKQKEYNIRIPDAGLRENLYENPDNPVSDSALTINSIGK